MPKQKKRSNLTHRPDSYWEHDDPLQEILSGISGTARRKMITDYWNAGKLDEMDEGLLQDNLDEDRRQRLGSIHPFFMGGEYLPTRHPGEVVIVRISLESTTYDVIELRARPLPDGKIGLRWVDEYEGEFHAPTETIERPFSFEELIAFIEATELTDLSNLPIAYTASNVECLGWDRSSVERLRYFTIFSSEFYPHLGDWAQETIDAFLDANIKDPESAEAEEV